MYIQHIFKFRTQNDLNLFYKRGICSNRQANCKETAFEADSFTISEKTAYIEPIFICLWSPRNQRKSINKTSSIKLIHLLYIRSSDLGLYCATFLSRYFY